MRSFKATKLLVLVALSTTALNCSSRQTLLEHQHALTDLNVGWPPPKPQDVIFLHHGNDERLRLAAPHLKAIQVKTLGLEGADITDASIPILLQLDSLEGINLKQTHVTIDGLCRLKALPRLKYLRFSESLIPDDEKWNRLLECFGQRVKLRIY